MSGAFSSFQFRTVIFDLDGTLIDSIADVTAAVNRVLFDANLEPIGAAAAISLLGEGARIRIKKAFEMRGVDLAPADLEARTRDFARYYAENPLVHTKVFDGARELLDDLSASGIRSAVCTNKYEQSARDILARPCLIPAIEDVAGSDTFGVQKPHADHIVKLLQRMGADPKTAIMVGDSIHDIEAAHAAGIPAVAVTWGYSPISPHELDADAVIGRFGDLSLFKKSTDGIRQG